MNTYEMDKYKRVNHTFEPVYNKDSKILIVGSLPSVKSRENGFYYGHPQNRFWKVIAGLHHLDVPKSIEEKEEMLLSLQIAIWDVIESCDIIGSSDSSITNVVPMDLTKILEHSKIERIYANGKTAAALYKKFSKAADNWEIMELPSTSPANAVYSLERLLIAWSVILH